MALSITKSRRTTANSSDLQDLVVNFNALLTVCRANFAKLDADGGVTATDYASDLDAGPKQIGDPAGTARA